MAQYASTNRTALSYIEEATFGTDPGTAKQELRYTGESVNFNITNITSDEIRSDRQTSDLIQVSAESAGDFNFEFSYGSYDELMEGAFADSWATATDDSTASSTAGGDETCTIVATGNDFDTILAGQKIYVDDGTTSGMFLVTSVDAGTDTIVVADPGDTLATVASTVIVKGAVLRNGIELHSYTVEKELRDANPVASFKFLGMRVGGMTLDFSIGAILAGTFSFMGLDSSTDTGAVTPTPTAATTTGVMNAVGDVGDILIDGVTSTACLNSLTMNLNNALRGQDCIGTLGHSGIALGRVDLTGNINIYFETNAEYQKFIDATSFSLSFSVSDNAGNSYVITIPEVKYETMTIVSGGLDADVMAEATWRGILDPVYNYTIEIVRVPAA